MGSDSASECLSPHKSAPKPIASRGVKPAYRTKALKPIVGLQTQIENDNGRCLQLRARWQSPELSGHNRLENIRNLGNSARITRVPTEFDLPQEGDWDC